MFFKLVLHIIVICFFVKYTTEENNRIVNDTELIFTFLVHRHGDRTPVSRSQLSLSNNPELLARVIDKYGFGQLTPRGQYRGYQVGQFIKRRYSSLLSSQYNSSEIYIRSTAITRTMMTVLTAMAAVYPPTDDTWSRDINWTPVPYTTVDVETDYLLSYGNCPKYLAFMLNFKPEFPQYRDILEEWSQITNIDFTNNPLLIYSTHDFYACQHSLGLPLHDALEEIWPEIEEVKDAVMEVIYRNEDYLSLLTGVLLNEFFKASSNVINSQDVPRVRVYSAHDINVIAMVAASKIQTDVRPGVPTYGAIFALELRRVADTGQYVVLVVYVPDPDKSEILYLPIEGCENLLCDFDYFKAITSRFLLEEKEWKEACKVDNDFSTLLSDIF